jgi:AcrR family transcriptional regulator
MARTRPPDRIADLVRTATQVFIAQGYRRTQMADVATALEVAKGTLYLYVESKEALFDLVVRHADGAEPLPALSELPFATPKPGQTLRTVRKRLDARRAPPTLLKALNGRQATLEPRAEVETISRELYDTLSANRVGIKLMDSSSRDTPELAELWFKGVRTGLVELLHQYLNARFRQKRLRAVPDALVAARLWLETLVFWAVHRHWDPAPMVVTEEAARDTAVHFVVAALAREES